MHDLIKELLGGGSIKKKILVLSIIIVILCSFGIFFIINVHHKDSKDKKHLDNIQKFDDNNQRENAITNDGGNDDNEKIDNVEKTNNKDIVGRIKISGTNIDEYVVQGDDNDYYLNHNLDGDENIAGSVFLDYRNNFSDRKLLIYGHNARKLTTVPFHDLEKYIEQTFYKSNKYIDLELNGNSSRWIIFSIMIVEKGNNNHMKITFNDEEWISHIKWLKDSSLYDTSVSVGLSDKVLILQTCNYIPENTYLLISAKKV